MRALVVLVSSLLVGIVLVGGIGGMLYPKLLGVAEPLVCSHGVYEIEVESSTAYCLDTDAARTSDGISSLLPDKLSNAFDNIAGNAMDNAGLRTDITMKAVLAAGVIYSIGAFVVISLFVLAAPRRR